MKTELITLVTLSLLGCTLAWPDLYDNEFKRWSLSRRSFDECMKSGDKCFSTSDCCNNYVCAAFDDFNADPTMPGWCVHEKQLEPCMSKYDCTGNKRCIELGGQHSYCVPVPEDLLAKQSKLESAARRAKGGIGFKCESDADCEMYADDGATKLCCQKVRQGRQRPTQRCDVIKPISTCIN